MSSDFTLPQSGDELRRAQQQSVQRQRPPTKVPGFEPVRFLGSGAYGEVWVMTDLNTRRRVAVKFYTHRGGLDWSLLSREVEKLAFLFADRYVVQLIDIGWDSDPPYYIMEYLEHGSLADRLRNGPLPGAEAVTLFRDITIGLVHAHGKGVLHCDLKPANVLLDQDLHPRLADFGQSRLSDEQKPALGTLFYMAPEQANLKAVPDARWDVYALGAVLYCMLTAEPPYRTTESATLLTQATGLEEQLERYVKFLHDSPKPDRHRRVPGVDRELADIVDKCLALNPNKRFSNPQAVFDALQTRSLRRARRPLLVLGALGPAALLVVMSLFAWSAAATSVKQSEAALVQRALEGHRFAARYVAESVAGHVNRRWSTLERAADDPKLREFLLESAGKPWGSDQRSLLQTWVELLAKDHPEIVATSWAVYDANGLQLSRAPMDRKTIDHNYKFRDYFHGRGQDYPQNDVPADVMPIKAPHRSVVFQSQATGKRMVAFTVPISSGPEGTDPHTIGVLMVTVELGKFSELRAKDTRRGQVAALVDSREDDKRRKGSILEHPYLAANDGPEDESTKLHLENSEVQRLNELRRLGVEEPTDEITRRLAELATIEDFRDPVGGEYSGRWLAAMEPVVVQGRDPAIGDTGWGVIVQERYEDAVRPPRELGADLVRTGLIALGVVVALITALWGFVMIVFNEQPHYRWWRYVRKTAGLAPQEGSGSSRISGTSASSASGDQPISPDTQA